MMSYTAFDLLNVISPDFAPASEHGSTQKPRRHAITLAFVITLRYRRAKTIRSAK